MKPKTLILMVVAVGCGLAASYMTSKLLADRRQEAPVEEKVDVLTAKIKVPQFTVIKEPDKLKDAIARAKRAVADGRPYLLDVHTWRDGIGAASTWHPPYSVAERRARKV